MFSCLGFKKNLNVEFVVTILLFLKKMVALLESLIIVIC